MRKLPTVLIVDDNPTQIRLMRLFLDSCGVPSHAVATGEEVLDCLKTTNCFSMVLMDWRMDPMDGLECTVKVRKQELMQHKPRVPIIGVTASAMTGDREKCLEAGMDDYLAKPITMNGFKAMLKRWLPGYAEYYTHLDEIEEIDMRASKAGSQQISGTYPTLTASAPK